jgi:hypothetical protein
MTLQDELEAEIARLNARRANEGARVERQAVVAAPGRVRSKKKSPGRSTPPG